MMGWKEKLLSTGGKETLIKSVIQSIPTYLMSCFLIPKSFCDDLQNYFNKFWWGDLASKRKIHWHSWNNMAKSKFDGGMGFRNLHCFNLALLAKQGWRLISQPDSLCAQVLKAKYFPKNELLQSKPDFAPSYIWRSL